MTVAALRLQRRPCGRRQPMEQAIMPVTSDLIERCVELKGELLEFALRPRFAKSYRTGMNRYFGEREMVDDVELANFLDWFALQQRPPGDRTVVEHFVTEHPQLSESEGSKHLAIGNPPLGGAGSGKGELGVPESSETAQVFLRARRRGAAATP
jgi:hypothetical protein